MSKCKTPDAYYCFAVKSGRVPSIKFSISLPQGIAASEGRCRRLEKALHDAAEEVMAPWFKRNPDGTAVKLWSDLPPPSSESTFLRMPRSAKRDSRHE